MSRLNFLVMLVLTISLSANVFGQTNQGFTGVVCSIDGNDKYEMVIFFTQLNSKADWKTCLHDWSNVKLQIRAKAAHSKVVDSTGISTVKVTWGTHQDVSSDSMDLSMSLYGVGDYDKNTTYSIGFTPKGSLQTLLGSKVTGDCKVPVRTENVEQVRNFFGVPRFFDSVNKCNIN